MAGQDPAVASPVFARAGDSSPASGPRSAAGQACELAACAIARFGMLDPDDHVLAAFSGGADSTALAIVLKKLGHRVTLAHIDHGMRPDSQLDAFHCHSTAQRLGMTIRQARVKVDPSTEAEARRVRYEALERMALAVGAGRIATGHTLNDEAETVKMRLARGGFGLGIPPVRGKIIRPLLEVSRRLTEAVCREAGVLYLEDPSNADLHFTRNRIRAELAAAPEEAIEHLAAVGAESLARKSALERRLRDFCGSLEKSTHPRIDRAALLSAPGPVARALVRLLLSAGGIEPSRQLVDDVLAKVALRPGSSLDLPGGLAVWCEPSDPGPGVPPDGGSLVLGRRTKPESRILPEVAIQTSGVTVAAQWGLKISVSVEPAPEPSSAHVFSRPLRSGRSIEEVFDADALSGGLKLRQWRPGDRFVPLRRAGSAGKKKLQDFFVDAKVPRSERHRTPLMTSGGDIIWVVGHRIDNRYKLTPQTRSVARIRVSHIGSRH